MADSPRRYPSIRFTLGPSARIELGREESDFTIPLADASPESIAAIVPFTDASAEEIEGKVRADLDAIAEQARRSAILGDRTMAHAHESLRSLLRSNCDDAAVGAVHGALTSAAHHLAGIGALADIGIRDRGDLATYTLMVTRRDGHIAAGWSRIDRIEVTGVVSV